MTRTRTAAATALLALTLPLTACSDDDESGTDPATEQPAPDNQAQGDEPAPDTEPAADEAALEQAVRDHMDAINTGDIDRILELTSARCYDQTETEAADMIDLIDTLYGDIEIQTLEISDLTADSAMVVGTTGIQALDEAGNGSRWIVEDGTWRQDDC